MEVWSYTLLSIRQISPAFLTLSDSFHLTFHVPKPVVLAATRLSAWLVLPIPWLLQGWFESSAWLCLALAAGAGVLVDLHWLRAHWDRDRIAIIRASSQAIWVQLASSAEWHRAWIDSSSVGTHAVFLRLLSHQQRPLRASIHAIDLPGSVCSSHDFRRLRVLMGWPPAALLPAANVEQGRPKSPRE